MAKRAAGGTGPSPKKTKTSSGEASTALPASLESEPSVQELLVAEAALGRQLKAHGDLDKCFLFARKRINGTAARVYFASRKPLPLRSQPDRNKP